MVSKVRRKEAWLPYTIIMLKAAEASKREEKASILKNNIGA